MFRRSGNFHLPPPSPPTLPSTLISRPQRSSLVNFSRLTTNFNFSRFITRFHVLLFLLFLFRSSPTKKKSVNIVGTDKRKRFYFLFFLSLSASIDKPPFNCQSLDWRKTEASSSGISYLQPSPPWKETRRVDRNRLW